MFGEISFLTNGQTLVIVELLLRLKNFSDRDRIVDLDIRTVYVGRLPLLELIGVLEVMEGLGEGEVRGEGEWEDLTEFRRQNLLGSSSIWSVLSSETFWNNKFWIIIY